MGVLLRPLLRFHLHGLLETSLVNVSSIASLRDPTWSTFPTPPSTLARRSVRKKPDSVFRMDTDNFTPLRRG